MGRGGGVRRRRRQPEPHERAVRGQSLNAALLEDLKHWAPTTITTHTDELASAAYRRQLIGVYVPRALALAWQRSMESGI